MAQSVKLRGHRGSPRREGTAPGTRGAMAARRGPLLLMAAVLSLLPAHPSGSGMPGYGGGMGASRDGRQGGQGYPYAGGNGARMGPHDPLASMGQGQGGPDSTQNFVSQVERARTHAHAQAHAHRDPALGCLVPAEAWHWMDVHVRVRIIKQPCVSLCLCPSLARALSPPSPHPRLSLLSLSLSISRARALSLSHGDNVPLRSWMQTT
jgi:hypothetical protein